MTSERTIFELIELPKTIELPVRPRHKAHPSHQEFDVVLSAEDPGTFRLVIRGSGAFFESFSLILLYSRPGIRPAVLLRLNGDHGYHNNPDGSHIDGVPHLHMFPYGVLFEAVSDKQPDHAIELPAELSTPARAWPIFREVAHINDDPRMAKHLARVCGTGGLQLALFEEED